MNSTLEVLKNRKSIRIYADRPVGREEKDLILQATMRAPTAGNMMLYSIIEVEDQALKDRLAITCDNQAFIAKAPYVLLFAADYQRWYDYFLASGVQQYCEQRGAQMRPMEEGDMMLAFCDALIAAQTAVIAAESLGIGSCYIGDILEQYEVHRDLFCLPRYVLPAALVVFGYPTAEQAARPQTPRYDREFIVHRDTYHLLDTPEIARMMRPQEDRFSVSRPDGPQNLGQFVYQRKFSSAFSAEMSRSVRAMLASWTGQ